jgi:hypothetical protein
MELLDHIASEIEQAMDDKKLQFEDALQTAFSNWEGQLQNLSFGLVEVSLFRKLLFKKSLQMIKRIFLMAFGCGIVIAALVTLLFKSNPQQEVV